MNALAFSNELFHFVESGESPERAGPLEHFDEVLVFLTKIGGHPKAREQLLLRHRSRVERLLSRLGSRAGMSKEDVEDASQEAVFWTLEAVGKFDQYRFLGPRTQRFQPFLDLVIKLRFANFARGVRRRRSHYSPLREQDAQTRDSTSAVVEAGETGTLLEDAVAALPDSLRDIVMGVSAGQSLHDLAESHHVSDRTIRRRWRESRAILGTRLGPLDN